MKRWRSCGRSWQSKGQGSGEKPAPFSVARKGATALPGAPADALVLPMTDDPAPAIALAETLRAGGIRVQLYGEQKKFKQKMAYANKLEVPFVVLLGEDEIAESVCSVKNMETGEQVKLAPEAASTYIRDALAAQNCPVILEK